MTSSSSPPLSSDPEGLHPCPVCESLVISDPGSYEICPVCGWEDDPYQSEERYETGANDISLYTARRRWLKSQRDREA